jgi:hypothetical protein
VLRANIKRKSDRALVNQKHFLINKVEICLLRVILHMIQREQRCMSASATDYHMSSALALCPTPMGEDFPQMETKF